jgi:hypothetical protein
MVSNNVTWGFSDAHYACPVCTRSLQSSDLGLRCAACDHVYLVLAGIPDFTLEGLEPGTDAALQLAHQNDPLPGIYETWF